WHAAAMVEKDVRLAIQELEQVLVTVRLSVTEIIGSGGGETKGTQRMRRALTDLGWRRGKFQIKKTINAVERQSITHEIDDVKEIEGNHWSLKSSRTTKTRSSIGIWKPSSGYSQRA